MFGVTRCEICCAVNKMNVVEFLYLYMSGCRCGGGGGGGGKDAEIYFWELMNFEVHTFVQILTEPLCYYRCKLHSW